MMLENASFHLALYAHEFIKGSLQAGALTIESAQRIVECRVANDLANAEWAYFGNAVLSEVIALGYVLPYGEQSKSAAIIAVLQAPSHRCRAACVTNKWDSASAMAKMIDAERGV